MPRALEGKTALITGAAVRLGREIALAAANEGLNVVIHHRSSLAQAKTLERELTERGVNSWLVQADLSKADELETLLQRSLAAAGSLDFLINSASTFKRESLSQLDFASLMQNVQVNAWAPFVLCREFKRLVGRGKIINLLDTRVRGYDWLHAGYILSKRLLADITRMMAVDYAPEITVNAIAPGLILPPPGEDQSYLERLVHTVPLKRHGHPGDIAEAVLFLMKSEFITGTVLEVDGGRHLLEYGNGPHSD